MTCNTENVRLPHCHFTASLNFPDLLKPLLEVLDGFSGVVPAADVAVVGAALAAAGLRDGHHLAVDGEERRVLLEELAKSGLRPAGDLTHLKRVLKTPAQFRALVGRSRVRIPFPRKRKSMITDSVTQHPPEHMFMLSMCH